MSKVKLILIALLFFFNSCWSSDKNSAAGVAAIATIWTWRDIFAEARKNSFKAPVLPESELKTLPGLFSPIIFEPDAPRYTPVSQVILMPCIPQLVWDYKLQRWVQILVPAQPY